MVTKFRRSRGYYNPKGAGKTKRVRSRLARKRNRKGLVRQVKQIVHSLTENKQAYTTSGNTLIKFNSGIDSTADIMPILPAIGQSVLDNGRIGDQIRAQMLNVKGYVKLDINEVSDSSKLPNVAVRMMIVSIKNKPSYADVTASGAIFATLLKKGGTTTGFTGLLSDLHAKINTDVFTIHHDKKFYLRQDFINAIGPSVPSQYVSQDISNTIKFFNLNVRCKNRLLRFDEDVSSGNWPVNFCPFLIMGYTYLDGSAPDVVDTKVGLSYDSYFSYEDA